MSEESKSSEISNTSADEQVQPATHHEPSMHSSETQRIFAERFNALMNGFGEDCETNNVELAVAIAIHPEENEPLVFIRGDEYHVARILAFVLKRMKANIMDELKT